MAVKKLHGVKCTECHGTPNQHNVKNPVIVVDDKRYPQHSFRMPS